MNKKILIPAILGLVVIAIFGFYYSQTVVVRINTQYSVDYSGKLMADFRDSNVSLDMLSGAEEKLNETEVLLDRIKEKDFSEYSFLHKEFLENMVGLVEERFEESKDRLDKAKEALENEDYLSVGENAYLSRAISTTLPRHLNNILEGREKKDWNTEWGE